VIESLKNLFVKQSIDTRIESALPLLARIQQQGTEMKEANIFEAWAERLVEGTWQTPDTPEKQAELVRLMSTDLPVGADATNATEQLYDLLGDDHLFDQLEALAEQDANADARQVVYDRMQELSDDPDVRQVIEQLQIDPTAEMNPAEPTNPADLEPMNENVLLDSTGSTLQHILDTFKRDVKDFKETGEVSRHLHDALYDYYHDDMPYGVQKARDGDPYEWVADRFGSDLGLPGYGSNSPGVPDEDYGIERESVMHGDYAEESKDPHTQQSDPAGTSETAYPEYQADLAGILKTAGVPAPERPAPDYETGDLEEAGLPGEQFGDDESPLKPGQPLPGEQFGDGEYKFNNDEEEAMDEGATCNMSEAGESCPVHGVEECWGADTSPLAGQYGHSGKLKAVDKDLSFLDRLKELSGMKK
jgi:hypothetical protein